MMTSLFIFSSKLRFPAPPTPQQLIQVLLEDKATESTIKVNLPLGQETLITLTDGQKFVIHISDVSQSSEDIYLTESNADTGDSLLD